MPSKPKSDPYCAFRNDRERRLAMHSRDARIVLVALILMLGASLKGAGSSEEAPRVDAPAGAVCPRERAALGVVKPQPCPRMAVAISTQDRQRWASPA